MNKKIEKKEGISLVALICTIVVGLIILSTVVFSFNNILNSTKKKEFANEIYTIEKMVEEYKFKNEIYPIISETEGTTNELDLYELGVNETKRGRKEKGEDDIYTIDVTTGKVTYKKGVKIGSITYYNLDDNNQELRKELGLK